MSAIRILAYVIVVVLCCQSEIVAQDIGPLEIHYINVGQGGSTMIIGPDGTSVLYDFGNIGRGKAVVEYLKDNLGFDPDRDPIDFTIVSHRDTDHYGGFVEIKDAGFDVLIANFDSGSDKRATPRMKKVWLTPASKTTAGAVRSVPVGLRIPLGDGAELRVVSANGHVFTSDEELPFARNENDRSISLYLKYNNFDYVLDGDLGAGEDSEENDCITDRDTSQRDFQTPTARVLVDLGMDENFGVDVLHIAHHGSESSTSADYFDLLSPEVGLISVGLNQRSFLHPRVDVVEDILVGPNRNQCVKSPQLQALFQTEVGKPGSSSTGSTSFFGMPIGDIILKTNGESEYTITGSGRAEGGQICQPVGAESWIFKIDDVATTTPSKSVNQVCLEDSSTCNCELSMAPN